MTMSARRSSWVCFIPATRPRQACPQQHAAEKHLFHHRRLPSLGKQCATARQLHCLRTPVGPPLTEAAHEFIGDAAYDPHYGARPLKRYLQSHVETPLAKFIIGGQVRDDQRVVIDATEDGLTFGVKSGDTVQPLQ